MKNRILHFLSAENITQSQFADTLGVARASVSHILSGRNKPSYEFIESLAKSYPSINLEWLITGKGRMYKDSYNDDLFDNDPVQVSPVQTQSNEAKAALTQPQPQTQIAPQKSGKRISRILVFYDDSTYCEVE